jgi:thiamine-phosphate pyrophosphorylase
VLTYYITDRRQFAGGEGERRSQLLRTIGQAAAAGVDFIQLREKDLATRELETLAREALGVIRSEGAARLLINHRTDVALAVGTDGVHLTGNDIAASDARALAARSGMLSRAPSLAATAKAKQKPKFLIAVSCHSAQQVRLAESHGADFAVLAPIFEKVNAGDVSGETRAVREGIGVDELRRAAQQNPSSDARVEAGGVRGAFPVFALGGVARERAPLCAAAGAAGIAGIRIFQQCDHLAELVRWLHAL